jgi:hypothetical protein
MTPRLARARVAGGYSSAEPSAPSGDLSLASRSEALPSPKGEGEDLDNQPDERRLANRYPCVLFELSTGTKQLRPRPSGRHRRVTSPSPRVARLCPPLKGREQISPALLPCGREQISCALLSFRREQISRALPAFGREQISRALLPCGRELISSRRRPSPFGSPSALFPCGSPSPLCPRIPLFSCASPSL